MRKRQYRQVYRRIFYDEIGIALLAIMLQVSPSFASGVDADAIKPTNLLFTHNEWKTIQNSFQQESDLIFLKDGTMLRGRLEMFPSLHYSFGNLRFTPKEIVLATFVEKSGVVKAQYITREGENYVASLTTQPLVFLENNTNANNLSPRHLDPSLISAILMSPREDEDSVENNLLYSLEFKNGDQLPVQPAVREIHLSSGKHETILSIDNVIDVSFNGGLQGTIIDDFGVPQELTFSLVKDPHFTFRLARHGLNLKMPWDRIANVQSRNGGFRQSIFDVPEEQMGQIAFASEAFEAYIQPPPEPVRPLHEGAGVSAVEDPDAVSYQAVANSIGIKNATSTLLFVDMDFDSPFNVAYQLEYVDSGNSKEFFVNASAEMVHEEEKELVAVAERAPWRLSESNLVRINETLLFEGQKAEQVDPEEFDVVELKD